MRRSSCSLSVPVVFSWPRLCLVYPAERLAAWSPETAIRLFKRADQLPVGGIGSDQRAVRADPVQCRIGELAHELLPAIGTVARIAEVPLREPCARSP